MGQGERIVYTAVVENAPQELPIFDAFQDFAS
jgi:hypothetical protein